MLLRKIITAAYQARRRIEVSAAATSSKFAVANSQGQTLYQRGDEVSYLLPRSRQPAAALARNRPSERPSICCAANFGENIRSTRASSALSLLAIALAMSS